MKKLLRVLLPSLAALLMSTSSHAQPAPLRPALPLLGLADAKSEGQRAIDLLGARLAEVAAYYGKSADEFRAMLLADRLLKLDRNGRLFVEDELPARAPLVSSESSLDGTLAPLDQTFLLHSRPGAKRTIYLNFRGATLSGTVWNGGGGTITALPFDLDGLPYSFSTAELQRIQYIWQRVVEDFAPFDVDVTTEPPPVERLTRSSSGDDVYGTTALITSRAGVYSCSCGGVAYIGIFDNIGDFYKPALVFYDALASNEKNIAEAISHEVGHNGGLRHDGTATLSYYTGHGSGATGWAPIMGVGYYQPLVQWSKGEYAGANNAEDDIVVLQSNGLPLRADDHGNSAGTATLLAATVAGSVASFSAEGVIERASDIDMFAFTSGAGTVSFSARPAVRSANLDVLIELRNAAGALLASANPVDGLPATLTATLASGGTYYVSVHGVGKGDRLATGYTDYGSLGQYALTGNAPSTAGTPPTAVIVATPTRGIVPLAVSFSSAGSGDADGSIVAYDWRFGDGSSATGATAGKVYTTAGSFSAQLQVTDNSGLMATKSVLITVDPPVAVPTMRVADIAMSLTGSPFNGGRANAVVTVRDGSGNAVAGATVGGTWSGLATGSATAVTSGSGAAMFASANTRGRGTYIFTVTGVALAGYTYTPALNTETSDSITR